MKMSNAGAMRGIFWGRLRRSWLSLLRFSKRMTHAANETYRAPEHSELRSRRRAERVEDDEYQKSV